MLQQNFAIMKCEDYLEQFWLDNCYELMDEMFWDRSFSSSKLCDYMLSHATSNNVLLIDMQDWNYDDSFYNTYQDMEKGLS